MNLFGKSISVTIVLIMLISVIPVGAAEGGTVEEGTITEHTPQSRILEEKEIQDSGGANWLWILLGAVVVIAGVAVLAGSGGSGGGEPSNINTGQLIDSPVQGLEYLTSTQSGTTDSQGSFRYEAGEKITFSIGNDSPVTSIINCPAVGLLD